MFITGAKFVNLKYFFYEEIFWTCSKLFLFFAPGNKISQFSAFKLLYFMMCRIFGIMSGFEPCKPLSYATFQMCLSNIEFRGFKHLRVWNQYGGVYWYEYIQYTVLRYKTVRYKTVRLFPVSYRYCISIICVYCILYSVYYLTLHKYGLNVRTMWCTCLYIHKC